MTIVASYNAIDSVSVEEGRKNFKRRILTSLLYISLSLSERSVRLFYIPIIRNAKFLPFSLIVKVSAIKMHCDTSRRNGKYFRMLSSRCALARTTKCNLTAHGTKPFIAHPLLRIQHPVLHFSSPSSPSYLSSIVVYVSRHTGISSVI